MNEVIASVGEPMLIPARPTLYMVLTSDGKVSHYPTTELQSVQYTAAHGYGRFIVTIPGSSTSPPAPREDQHVCDNRCLGDEGHHAWPLPAPRTEDGLKWECVDPDDGNVVGAFPTERLAELYNDGSMIVRPRPAPATVTAQGLTLRPSVAEFAQRMETVLRRHDSTKGGQENWRKDEASDLLKRLREEVKELGEEIRDGYTAESAKEAIDVANFAMMIADVCDPLPRDDAPRPAPAGEVVPTPPPDVLREAVEAILEAITTHEVQTDKRRPWAGNDIMDGCIAGSWMQTPAKLRVALSSLSKYVTKEAGDGKA